MTSQGHILYNKLAAPPKNENLLPRPKLDALLSAALQKPLVIVAAGAGFGKTQAVAAALEAEDCRVVWLQLSELDNLCMRLWERLIYAYRPWSEGLCDELEILGFPITAQAFDQYLRLLAEKTEGNQRWVFVLDDFHLIHEPEILRFVERFAFAQIENLSLVLISRSQPDISVAAMMSKGLLARVTEKQLRLTLAETQAYYSSIGVELSCEKSQLIYGYTDGWGIAVYLVGLSLQNGEQFNKGLPTAAQADLFSMIEKEIFLTASPQLQNLMLRTSLLDNLPLPLLKRLCGEDAALAQQLLGIGLFLRDDTFADTFRFHHLLQEFLGTKHSELLENETKNTYLTAAAWFGEGGADIDALRYLVKAGQYLSAYDIILRYANRVPAELASLFIEIIDESGAEFIAQRPIMQIVRAKFVLNNGDIKEAYAQLQSLRTQYEGLPVNSENSAVLGEVYVMLGILCFVLKTLDFPKLFKMADALLPQGSAIVNNKMMLVGSSNYCIIKSKKAGELKKLQEAFLTGMPYASRVMNGCGSGLEYLVAGEAAYFTGDMKTAEENAHQAITRAQGQQQVDIEYSANYLLLRVYVYRGHYDKIITMLQELKAKKIHIEECISMYDIVEAAFYLQLRRTDKVAKWITFETPQSEKDVPISMGMDSLIRTHCYLLEGRFSELLAFTQRMLPVFEERGILLGMVSYYTHLALAHHYLGNRKEAMQALERSYELCWENEVIMIHIALGGPMRSLIHAAKQDKSCKIPRAWLDMIYTKASTQDKRQAKLRMDHNLSTGENTAAALSKREREVLWDLCQGLTREEIAESCGLSVNTVKSMLQSIYSKLGAATSMDAVRIAAKQGLL